MKHQIETLGSGKGVHRDDIYIGMIQPLYGGYLGIGAWGSGPGFSAYGLLRILGVRRV